MLWCRFAFGLLCIFLEMSRVGCEAQIHSAAQSETSQVDEQHLTIHKNNNVSGHALGLTLCVNGEWQHDCSQNPIAGNPVGIYIDISTTGDRLPIWAINPLCNVRGEADGDCRVAEVDLNNWGSDAAARSGSSARPGDHLKLGVDVVTGGPIPSTCAYCEINAPSSGSWHYDILLHRAIDSTLAVNAPYVDQMETMQPVEAGSCRLDLNVGENYEVLRGMTGTLDTGAQAEDILIGSDASSIQAVSGHLRLNTTCLKSHSAGARFTTYTARRGLDLSNAAYQNSSLNLGSLFWQTRHATHPAVHIAINDLDNREQTAESYISLPKEGIQHEFHDLGAGFLFDGNVTSSSVTTSSVRTQRGTPQSSSEGCSQGEMWSDANYVYVCVASNQIRRAALVPF